MTNYQKTVKWFKISLVLGALGLLLGLAGGLCFVGCNQAEHAGKMEACNEYYTCKEVRDTVANRQIASDNGLTIRERHYDETLLATTFGGLWLAFPTGIIFCWFLLLHMLGQASNAIQGKE